MLTTEQHNRYIRQLELPDFGVENQENLLQSRVVIVGAGGLGCPIGLYLAGAGVGNLCVIDEDVVALSNLHRQIAFSLDEIGLPKAQQLVRVLKGINPGLNFEAVNTRLLKNNCKELLEGADLVIDGTDNFAAKFLIADTCHDLKLPYIQVAVFQYQCQLMLCIPEKTPCYRCVFEKPPSTTLGACSLAGTLGSAVGTAATIAATEALKFIAGMPSAIAGNLFLYDASKQTMNTVELNFDTNCSLCGTNSKRTNHYLVQWDTAHLGYPAALSLSRVEELVSSGATLVDVRESFEYESFHLPGSISFPLSMQSSSLDELRELKTPVIIYCETGNRSALVLQKAGKLGLKKIYQLDGGLVRWEQQIGRRDSAPSCMSSLRTNENKQIGRLGSISE